MCEASLKYGRSASCASLPQNLRQFIYCEMREITRTHQPHAIRISLSGLWPTNSLGLPRVEIRSGQTYCSISPSNLCTRLTTRAALSLRTRLARKLLSPGGAAKRQIQHLATSPTRSERSARLWMFIYVRSVRVCLSSSRKLDTYIWLRSSDVRVSSRSGGYRLPTGSPGQVSLVRNKSAGEVSWQGHSVYIQYERCVS